MSLHTYTFGTDPDAGSITLYANVVAESHGEACELLEESMDCAVNHAFLLDQDEPGVREIRFECPTLEAEYIIAIDDEPINGIWLKADETWWVARVGSSGYDVLLSDWYEGAR